MADISRGDVTGGCLTGASLVGDPSVCLRRPYQSRDESAIRLYLSLSRVSFFRAVDGSFRQSLGVLYASWYTGLQKEEAEREKSDTLERDA